jgi:hypothetical protein
MVSDAEQLANWRTIGARYSEQVLELAPKVLKSGGLGEQGKLARSERWKLISEWGVREQLAIAALDLGRISVAKVC